MSYAQDFNPFQANPGTLKEFRVLLSCTVCGDTFDSDYKLMKHMSKSHPSKEKSGWTGGEGEENCSCGGHMHSQEHGHG